MRDPAQSNRFSPGAQAPRGARWRRVGAALLGAALVWGCLGPPKPPPELRADGLPFRELPPQRLTPGECALFLWAQTADAEGRRIIMVHDDPLVARVRMRKRVFDFPLVRREGAPIAGLYPKMTFEEFGAQFTLDLVYTRTPRLTDGFVVESGSLSYTAVNGWSSLTPVIGIVACEPGR